MPTGITIAPVVGSDTIPVLAILRAVVAPLLPTFMAMLSVVPTPDVDCNVSVDDAVVPPTMRGDVTEVANVGSAVVLIVTAPVDEEAVIFVPPVMDVTPAVDGIVDDQVGAPPVLPIKTSPVLPAAVVVIADEVDP